MTRSARRGIRWRLHRMDVEETTEKDAVPVVDAAEYWRNVGFQRILRMVVGVWEAPLKPDAHHKWHAYVDSIERQAMTCMIFMRTDQLYRSKKYAHNDFEDARKTEKGCMETADSYDEYYEKIAHHCHKETGAKFLMEVDEFLPLFKRDIERIDEMEPVDLVVRDDEPAAHGCMPSTSRGQCCN